MLGSQYHTLELIYFSHLWPTRPNQLEECVLCNKISNGEWIQFGQCDCLIHARCYKLSKEALLKCPVCKISMLIEHSGQPNDGTMRSMQTGECLWFTKYWESTKVKTVLNIRFPLRLDFQHSTERPVLITDQPYIFIFSPTITKILQWANKNRAFSKFRVIFWGQIFT